MKAGPVVLAWLLIYASWLVTTRAYHPTWPVAASATAILVAAYASAVTLDLGPLARLRSRRGLAAYLAALLAMEVAFTLGAVVAIQAAYDVLWEPDPRRFGFRTNFVMDFAGMTLHVLAGEALARAWRRICPARDRAVT